MSNLKLSDLDATSGYNSIALDPDKVEKLIAENKVLRESRDSLLNALKYIKKRINDEVLGLLDGTTGKTIQRAEALKQKETK